MHEELTNLTQEIQAGIDDLKKNSKRMATDVRDQKVNCYAYNDIHYAQGLWTLCELNGSCTVRLLICWTG